MKKFIEEMQWRGMIHDIIPGTEEQLNKEMTIGYVGFDPTSSSLTVGNLVTVMLLIHLQKAGHKPVALIGGATGMIGDPSGKSEERNFLTEEILQYNQDCIKKQLEKFLDFNNGINSAELVNNYDWFKNFNFLNFLRQVGKHVSVNSMINKDSVQKRLKSGISFTEFSYQILQGYDFLHLYRTKNIKLQMGGADQWGNIIAGTDLIRKIDGGEAFAFTTPLLTKSDGTKFGKSEGGNIWLDPNKTSPWKFYQFWLNTTDNDVLRMVKIFTLMSKEEINDLYIQHNEKPELRLLQKKLAEDITCRVHSVEELNKIIKVSEILFGKNSTIEDVEQLDESILIDALELVKISKNDYKETLVIDILVESKIFSSKSEARKMIQQGGVSINKNKILDITAKLEMNLIKDKYLLIQKGKKNYYLLEIC